MVSEKSPPLYVASSRRAHGEKAKLSRFSSPSGGGIADPQRP
ncbi:hypothetical protein NJ7G_1437 [Natrinema sp. J7-2]|nr:hypothetical protein NJ7G_1437 [Natrinema sp. J7-2]